MQVCATQAQSNVDSCRSAAGWPPRLAPALLTTGFIMEPLLLSEAGRTRGGVTAAVRAAAPCWLRRRADHAAWEEGASSACRTLSVLVMAAPQPMETLQVLAIGA